MELQILVEKLGWPGVIRLNASDLGGSDENVLRSLGLVELLYGRGVKQVQFVARMPNEVAKTAAVQFAPQGAADQAAVSGDKDSRCWLKFHGATITRAGARDKGKDTRRLVCGRALRF